MTSSKKSPPDTPKASATAWQEAAIREFEELTRTGVPARENLWESIKSKHDPLRIKALKEKAKASAPRVKAHVETVGEVNPPFNHKAVANRRGVDDENFRVWLRQFFNEAKHLPPPRMTQGTMSLELGRAFSYIGVYLVSPERSLTREDLIKIGEITRQDLSRFLLPDVSSQKDPDTRSR